MACSKPVTQADRFMNPFYRGIYGCPQSKGCYEYLVSLPFAERDFEEHTYTVMLKGEGAARVKNIEIINILTAKGLLTRAQAEPTGHYFASTANFFERRITLKADLEQLPMCSNMVTIDSWNENQVRYSFDFYETAGAITSFKVHPVPPTVNLFFFRDIINDFVLTTRMTRDPNDQSTVWCSTKCPRDMIPYYIFTDQLVKSDTTFRQLKVTVPGRASKCPHCPYLGVEHQEHKCPRKAQHLRELKNTFNHRQEVIGAYTTARRERLKRRKLKEEQRMRDDPTGEKRRQRKEKKEDEDSSDSDSEDEDYLEDDEKGFEELIERYSTELRYTERDFNTMLNKSWEAKLTLSRQQDTRDQAKMRTASQDRPECGERKTNDFPPLGRYNVAESAVALKADQEAHKERVIREAQKARENAQLRADQEERDKLEKERRAKERKANEDNAQKNKEMKEAKMRLKQNNTNQGDKPKTPSPSRKNNPPSTKTPDPSHNQPSIKEGPSLFNECPDSQTPQNQTVPTASSNVEHTDQELPDQAVVLAAPRDLPPHSSHECHDTSSVSRNPPEKADQPISGAKIDDTPAQQENPPKRTDPDPGPSNHAEAQRDLPSHFTPNSSHVSVNPLQPLSTTKAQHTSALPRDLLEEAKLPSPKTITISTSAQPDFVKKVVISTPPLTLNSELDAPQVISPSLQVTESTPENCEPIPIDIAPLPVTVTLPSSSPPPSPQHKKSDSSLEAIISEKLGKHRDEDRERLAIIDKVSPNKSNLSSDSIISPTQEDKIKEKKRKKQEKAKKQRSEERSSGTTGGESEASVIFVGDNKTRRTPAPIVKGTRSAELRATRVAARLGSSFSTPSPKPKLAMTKVSYLRSGKTRGRGGIVSSTPRNRKRGTKQSPDEGQSPAKRTNLPSNPAPVMNINTKSLDDTNITSISNISSLQEATSSRQEQSLEITNTGTELISQRVTADNTSELDFCPPGETSSSSPRLDIDLSEENNISLNQDNGGFHDETGLFYEDEAVDETPEHAREDDAGDLNSPPPSPDASDIVSEVVTTGIEAGTIGQSDPPPTDSSASFSLLESSAHNSDPPEKQADSTTSPLKSDMERF